MPYLTAHGTAPALDVCIIADVLRLRWRRRFLKSHMGTGDTPLWDGTNRNSTTSRGQRGNTRVPWAAVRTLPFLAICEVKKVSRPAGFCGRNGADTRGAVKLNAAKLKNRAATQETNSRDEGVL